MLGVLEEIKLLDKEADRAVGDVLILYTDGLSEAINEEYEEFGVARLKEIVAAKAAQNAEQICQAITQFVSGADQSDDFTLMVIKRTGNGLTTLFIMALISFLRQDPLRNPLGFRQKI